MIENYIPMSVRLYVLLLLLCFGKNAQAQQKTKILHINGAVKDTNGIFLDSAIIFTAKDTALSDTAGKFKINVTSGDSVFIAKKATIPMVMYHNQNTQRY